MPIQDSRYASFAGSLVGHLFSKGVDFVIEGDNCLCEKPDLTGLDVVVAHPHYDNKNGCWDRINEVLSENRDVHFFLMAICAGERERFFGEQPNLSYITGGAFFSSPLTFINAALEES